VVVAVSVAVSTAIVGLQQIIVIPATVAKRVVGVLIMVEVLKVPTDL